MNRWCNDQLRLFSLLFIRQSRISISFAAIGSCVLRSLRVSGANEWPSGPSSLRRPRRSRQVRHFNALTIRLAIDVEQSSPRPTAPETVNVPDAQSRRLHQRPSNHTSVLPSSLHGHLLSTPFYAPTKPRPTNPLGLSYQEIQSRGGSLYIKQRR
jgi:hypothetical protein